METTILCMAPDCPKEADTRGLCGRHYRLASTLVNRGKTTWEELVKNGKCKEVTNKNRKSVTDWFLNKPTPQ